MNLDLNQKRDRIVELVKTRGPLLPINVSKDINTDIMFAGALLSELVESGKIKITSVKLGSSPFYYFEGQERRLEELKKYLNEKDLQSVELLKEKKILRDSECSPLGRVSLREVKDFAKPIHVKIDERIEIFWKWFLFSEEEAKELIKDILKKESLEVEVEKKKDKEQRRVKEFEVDERIGKLAKEADDVDGYFRDNGINVIKKEIIKRKKEINYVVELDSGIGRLRFFVKFKDKKKISDGDLSLALNEAGKMPLMFLSSGNLSKKAENLMKEEFIGIIFKKI